MFFLDIIISINISLDIMSIQYSSIVMISDSFFLLHLKSVTRLKRCMRCCDIIGYEMKSHKLILKMSCSGKILSAGVERCPKVTQPKHDRHRPPT